MHKYPTFWSIYKQPETAHEVEGLRINSDKEARDFLLFIDYFTHLKALYIKRSFYALNPNSLEKILVRLIEFPRLEALETPVNSSKSYAAVLQLRQLKQLTIRLGRVVATRSFAQLTALESLSVGLDAYTNFPSGIEELKIKTLAINDCEYFDLPIAKQVETLHLGGPGFLKPEKWAQIERFPNLKYLTLDFKRSIRFPKQFKTQLSSIKIKGLVREFPNVLHRQEALKELAIDLNEYWSTGKFLPPIAKFSNLERLMIQSKIDSLPKGFSKLKALQQLDLNLALYERSTLPFSDLSQLKHLHLSNWENFDLQKLLALIPIEKLKSLSFSAMQLKEIPTFLQDAKRLESLILNDNGIVKIPDAIAQLPSLRYFECYGNPLDERSASLEILKNAGNFDHKVRKLEKLARSPSFQLKQSGFWKNIEVCLEVINKSSSTLQRLLIAQITADQTNPLSTFDKSIHRVKILGRPQKLSHANWAKKLRTTGHQLVWEPAEADYIFVGEQLGNHKIPRSILIQYFNKDHISKPIIHKGNRIAYRRAQSQSYLCTAPETAVGLRKLLLSCNPDSINLAKTILDQEQIIPKELDLVFLYFDFRNLYGRFPYLLDLYKQNVPFNYQYLGRIIGENDFQPQYLEESLSPSELNEFKEFIVMDTSKIKEDWLSWAGK